VVQLTEAYKSTEVSEYLPDRTVIRHHLQRHPEAADAFWTEVHAWEALAKQASDDAAHFTVVLFWRRGLDYLLATSGLVGIVWVGFAMQWSAWWVCAAAAVTFAALACVLFLGQGLTTRRTAELRKIAARSRLCAAVYREELTVWSEGEWKHAERH